MFSRQHPSPADDRPAQIYIHADLLTESARLIRQHPTTEVGGKLVGYRIRKGSPAPASPYGKTIRKFWQKAAGQDCLVLVGSIGSGPNARADATSLMPDGPFQEAVFNELVGSEPELEHLGSWHSHHPNGARDFSPGDRSGYAANVSDPRHHEDIFVAGLCFDNYGLSSGIFDLYLRETPATPIRLSRKEVDAVDSIPSLQPRIVAAEADLSGPQKAPAIAAALREAVGGKVEQTSDADGHSWILTWPRAPHRQAVVMYKDGDPQSAGVSVTVKSDDAELTFHAGTASQAAIHLSHDLTEAVQTIARALSKASHKAR